MIWIEDNGTFDGSFAELISLEVPLVNPLHIPVTLNDVRLLWQFSEGSNGNQDHVSSNCQVAFKDDSPYVTTYVTPRLHFNPSSSHKVMIKTFVKNHFFF